MPQPESQPEPAATSARKRRLSGVLSIVFFIALFMGPGPGNSLLRSDPGDPPALFLGMPALYAWTVFWFLVMASIVGTAAFFLWSDRDGDAS